VIRSKLLRIRLPDARKRCLCSDALAGPGSARIGLTARDPLRHTLRYQGCPAGSAREARPTTIAPTLAASRVTRGSNSLRCRTRCQGRSAQSVRVYRCETSPQGLQSKAGRAITPQLRQLETCRGGNRGRERQSAAIGRNWQRSGLVPQAPCSIAAMVNQPNRRRSP
jgi:hypothetical protein